MSAIEVTDKVIEKLDSNKYDVVILNYANCDMVGHTGIMDAAINAVKTVDACIDKVIKKILSLGGTALVTADHGNADKMIDEDGKPFTAHTTNKVPFILIGDKFKGVTLRNDGILADIAPTMLEVMNVELPKEMEGKTLIIK